MSMNNKQKYHKLCEIEPTIPLFSKAWWLDTVIGEENWDVAIVENGEEVIGSLPYYKTRNRLFTIIKMPKLTQSMGIWVKYPKGQKYEKRLSYEKKVIDDLIEQLPKFDYFFQKFHCSFENWLPLYWKGFEQTTHYTYVLEDLSDKDKLFTEFKENTRREIRKALKGIEVFEKNDIEAFYELNKLTFDRQRMEMPYSLEFLKNLDKACEEHNARKMFFAKDADGRLHGAIYIVWDEQTTYYIMGGGDPDLRNSGATSLLMWEAIQFASTKTDYFNFEGSMIEPIERFFRSFGARQKPYFRITKKNVKAVKLMEGLVNRLFRT